MNRRIRIVVVLTVVLMLLPSISGAANMLQVHRVGRGESLWIIARDYKASLQELLKQNQYMTGEEIYPEQVLIVPTPLHEKVDEAPQPQPEPDFQYTNAQLQKDFPDTFFTRGSAGSNKVALTFDDGPHDHYTNQVLDVLQELDVPATFFVVGWRVQKHPEVVKRMVGEGHLVGNHTWNHPNLRRISEWSVRDQMQRTEDAIHNAIGLRTATMRPPYGAVTPETLITLKDMDYKAINWSVDSIDWRDQDVDKILINTLPDVRGGGILLFHDAGGEGQSRAATVASLPEIIHTLRTQGYEFVTVDQLLDIPAYK